MPALAQGETDVPFTDIPKNFNPNPSAPTHPYDIRKIDGMLTPKDVFFTTQHFPQPEIDPAAYRLKFTGMVNKPAEFTLADLKAMKSVELVNGFECSGNSGRSMQGLASCARFTGVPLSRVLKQLGVNSKAREVVFFGYDHGSADVTFRQQTLKLDQQFGRSITLENAMKPEPFIAYALNGDPLTENQGFPVRLIMPGWYGVANVKWLAEIHLQEERYVGNYQARWYRTIWGEGGSKDGTTANAVGRERSHPHEPEVGDRPRPGEGVESVLGFVLNDGTPLKSVEVKIDDGPWQKATLDPPTRSIRGSSSPIAGRRHAGRAHARLAGHRRGRTRATDIAELSNEEDFPRGQRSVPAQADDQLSR